MTARKKIRIDMADLTLGEMVDLCELTGRPLSALQGSDGDVTAEMVGLLAIAVVVMRRTNPDYTMADARQLKMGDLDIVRDADPKPQGANNGAEPALSPATGG